jgi:hypothetical protein
MDERVYAVVWNRIKQFWTGEKWIRVTDDQRNVRFVGFNVPEVDQMTGMQIGMKNPIGELDVDITIEDAPDGISPQQEQFQGLVELAQAGIPIPPLAIMEAAPNLRNREKIIQMMEEQAQKGDPETAKLQAQMQLEQQKAEFTAQQTAQKNEADLERKEREGQIGLIQDAQRHAQEMEFARQKHELSLQAERDKTSIQVDGEKSKRVEQTREPQVEQLSEALVVFGKDLSEGLKEFGASVAQAVTAPKKVELIRDKNGRAQGAIQEAVL